MRGHTNLYQRLRLLALSTTCGAVPPSGVALTLAFPRTDGPGSPSISVEYTAMDTASLDHRPAVRSAGRSSRRQALARAG